MWYEKTKALRNSGKLQIIGIIEEQHPDRCKLFMQWKQMDFPVLVDAFNLLDVQIVPMALLLDEYGVIRIIHPDIEKLDAIEKAILDQSYPPPADIPAPAEPDLAPLADAVNKEKTAEALRYYATALAMWQPEWRLTEASLMLQWALRPEPDHAATHFYAGVVYRKRYDSPNRKPDDFQRAVYHWQRALELAPNNYIYRRRIQQYGPRLDKPYPFYDWIAEARKAIEARGETPYPLPIEPYGAELAAPQDTFATVEATAPDPKGAITRDEAQLIQLETTAVPTKIKAGEAIRVHIILRPQATAYWNNEAEGTVLWVNAPAGWQIDRPLQTLPLPNSETDDAPRIFEFEARSPDNAQGTTEITFYVLYYVCEQKDGVCLYRRQDGAVTIEVSAATAQSNR